MKGAKRVREPLPTTERGAGDLWCDTQLDYQTRDVTMLSYYRAAAANASRHRNGSFLAAHAAHVSAIALQRSLEVSEI
jgi:hypothetical protein